MNRNKKLKFKIWYHHHRSDDEKKLKDRNNLRRQAADFVNSLENEQFVTMTECRGSHCHFEIAVWYWENDDEQTVS